MLNRCSPSKLVSSTSEWRILIFLGLGFGKRGQCWPHLFQCLLYCSNYMLHISEIMFANSDCLTMSLLVCWIWSVFLQHAKLSAWIHDIFERVLCKQWLSFSAFSPLIVWCSCNEEFSKMGDSNCSLDFYNLSLQLFYLPFLT